MRDQILYGAMQRYDPECWLQAMSAESNIDDTGENVPPATQEICVETSEQMPKSQLTRPSVNVSDSSRAFEVGDFKNGAVFEHHCWSQTLKDLEVQVQLPPALKTAKQLTIDIKAQQIKVSSKTTPVQVILEGTLSQRIRQNEAMWSIEDGRLLICCGRYFKPMSDQILIG